LAGNGQGNLATTAAHITGNQYRSFNGTLVRKIRHLGYSLNAEDQQFITKKTINHKSVGWATHAKVLIT
jgi:hypothetical protein